MSGRARTGWGMGGGLVLVSLGSLGGVRTGWSEAYWSVLCCSVLFGVRSVVRGLYSVDYLTRVSPGKYLCN